AYISFQSWFDLCGNDRILSTRHIPPLERPPYSERSVVQATGGYLDRRFYRPSQGPLHRGQGQRESHCPVERAAARRRQRLALHADEGRKTECAADDSVNGGDHAKAAARQACDPSARGGTVHDWKLPSQSHALSCESGNRRCHRLPGASDGEATGGHARMGPRRRGSGLRQGRGPTLCGRPYLANTTGKCRTVLESRQRLHLCTETKPALACF